MPRHASSLALIVTLTACVGDRAGAVDASVDADVSPPLDAPREDAPGDVPREAALDEVARTGDAKADAPPADVMERPGPVELGGGADAWISLPRSGGRSELVAGPQGGWHIFGRVRLRGIEPDVYLTFALTPEEGGEPVNLANETVRRLERRGLVRVGDLYESSYGELVILRDGLRPMNVVGRRFTFSVRVERSAAMGGRETVATDARGITVVDEVP